MNFKKTLAFALALVMSVSLLAACGGNTGNNGGSANNGANAGGNGDSESTETIQVAALASAYEETYPGMWQEVCDAFTAETGIKVDLITDKNLEDVIGASMKAGEFPDFIHLSTGREDALTESFIKDQGIEEVTDVLSMTIPGEDVVVGDKILDGFTDSSVTNPYGDGKTYFAPMFYAPCGLFYNAGLLEEKGWEVPTTWDEMWELGDKAKAEGISLFAYPTHGYLQEFTFALIYAVGGPEFFNKVTNYEEGVWESDEGKQVLDIIAKLATYTDPTVPANANNQDFTKNQQLILDNKAVFMPNGTWVVGEMAEAPRAEGFEWGFTAIPAVTEGGDAYGVAWIEQAWIPAAAEHKDAAKQFMAFLYSDTAAEIFAKGGAIQPIAGITDGMTGDNALFYSIYDNGAKPAMGSWAATQPVEGVSIVETLCGSVNSLVSGTMTQEEWTAKIIEVNDILRENKM